VGSPLVFRAKRLPDGAFSGVRAPSPPGGEADKQLVPESVEDGVASQIAEGDFERAGAWTCVARGSFLGQDDALNRARYGTWSHRCASTSAATSGARRGRSRSRAPGDRRSASPPSSPMSSQARAASSRCAG
jgi:hypothetical protein